MGEVASDDRGCAGARAELDGDFHAPQTKTINGNQIFWVDTGGADGTTGQAYEWWCGLRGADPTLRTTPTDRAMRVPGMVVSSR